MIKDPIVKLILRQNALESIGSVWEKPTRIYNSILEKHDNPTEALRECLSLGVFSQFSAYSSPEFIWSICKWYLEILESLGLHFDILDNSIEESKLVRPQVQVEIKGRLLSPDFLRFLSYVGFLRSRGAISSKTKRILEIGSGYGGLARAIKLFHQESTIVLVDIPQSLVWAYMFIKDSFENVRILVVDSTCKRIENIDRYDFIFVPSENYKILYDNEFDLFINTASLGEMPEIYVKRWFDLIQQEINVEYIFLLNRFPTLSHIHQIQRLNEGNWLSKIDQQWEILSFEFEPFFHRCPYITVIPSLLCILAKKLPISISEIEHKSLAKKILEEIVIEDWVISSLKEFNDPYLEDDQKSQTLFTFKSVKIDEDTVFELDKYAAGVDNRLLGKIGLDGDMNGALFKLWNAVRLWPSPLTIRLFRIYLRILRGLTPPGIIFREEYFYGCMPSGKFNKDRRLILPDWYYELEKAGTGG